MSLYPIIIFGSLLIFIIASVIIGLVVYTIIYNARIKKRLSQGITTGKQWPQPKSVVMIILIVTLSIIAVVAIANGFKRADNSTINLNRISDAGSFLSHELQDSPYEHYIEAYEKGELSGYTLTEATEDEFHYMYFKSEDSFSLLHPSFVLFVEYTGNESYKGYIDSVAISCSSEVGVSVYDCGEASDYFCVIGNVNHLEGECVTYELNLHKTEDDAKSYLENRINENDVEALSSDVKSIVLTTTDDSILVLN